jgi:hypothetical protein
MTCASPSVVQAAQARIMPRYEPIDRCRRALHRFALAQDCLPGGGDGKSLGCAAEELGSELLLESGEPAPDRRMIDAERAGCARQASITGNSQKKADIIPLPHRSAPGCEFMHMICALISNSTSVLRRQGWKLAGRGAVDVLTKCSFEADAGQEPMK